ncbi:3-demethylubiquinone-9 3-methyltransferase [Salinicoccus sediminis]|uniref:3-demethylubiquinone-9 3-methyltransferase n=1 Tax=Salinicoccus sediminis TaxID=1432562 RepID=A0A0M2SL01_9STAP|nr:VOC family protein [Salinicoccus sediminis]KKK34908.1 3-demethylubiquinone-9 3-methyltransferase [Salinicoccus sediminis]
MNYQRIVPHLWFDDEAEEAMAFYTEVFPESKHIHTCVFPDTPSGDAEQITFELMGYRFMGINAGPYFTKNPAISFLVTYAPIELEQMEAVWEKLLEDGKALMPFQSYPFSEKYGWVQDKYGVSWQFLMTDEAQAGRMIPTFMFINDNLGKAGEALEFYTNIFKGSKTDGVYNYPDGMEPNLPSHVMHGEFELENQHFSIMDSAEQHDFNFNEGISLMINAENQDEIDYYWEKLSAVPEAEECGWIKDRYGVSWQILPKVMDDMAEHGTPEQIERLTAAFLRMKKFDIAELERAFEGIKEN